MSLMLPYIIDIQKGRSISKTLRIEFKRQVSQSEIERVVRLRATITEVYGEKRTKHLISGSVSSVTVRERALLLVFILCGILRSSRYHAVDSRTERLEEQCRLLRAQTIHV